MTLKIDENLAGNLINSHFPQWKDLPIRFVSKIRVNAIIICLMVCILSHSAFAKEIILLQGAMDIEIDHLRKNLKNAKEERIGAWTFWIGDVGKHHVIVSRTEVGLVNASAATTIAVKQYQPTIIINQGTAGAHDKTLHQGDLVIGESALNIGSMVYEDEKQPFGEFFEVTQQLRNKDNSIQANKRFCSDTKLLEKTKRIQYKHGKVVYGTIASADQWNKDYARINYFHSKFNSLAEEMETVAVAQVASAFSIPFLAIRVISNAELHEEAFRDETARWSQEYTLDFIRKML